MVVWIRRIRCGSRTIYGLRANLIWGHPCHQAAAWPVDSSCKTCYTASCKTTMSPWRCTLAGRGFLQGHRCHQDAGQGFLESVAWPARQTVDEPEHGGRYHVTRRSPLRRPRPPRRRRREVPQRRPSIISPAAACGRQTRCWPRPLAIRQWTSQRWWPTTCKASWSSLTPAMV